MKHSWRWLWLLFILTFLLRLPSLFEPYWHGDEGISLALGQAVRRGELLYRDMTDNKPPLLYLMYAVGGTIQWGKWMTLIWSLGTISVFYLFSRLIFSEKIKKLSTLLLVFMLNTPLFEGNVVNGEIYFMLPTTLAMCVLWKYQHSKILWPFFITGILMAIGALFKLPAMVELGAIVLFLFLSEKKLFSLSFIIRCVMIASGFVLPWISIMFIFYLKGALGDFWLNVIIRNLGYSGWQNYFLLPYLYIIFIVSMLLFFYREQINSKSLFAIIWFLFALLGSRLSIRPYTHYLIQVLPAFCLLVGLYFANLKRERVLSVALVFFIFITLTQFPFNLGTLRYQVSYYANFFAYALKLRSVTQYHTFFDPHVPRTYKAAEFLRQHTQLDDRVFIWGDDALIYDLADRRPIGRFSMAYHIMDWDKEFKETIQDLTTRKPSFIMVSTERMTIFPFPYLQQLLAQEYTYETAFEDILVYRRSI